MSRYHRSVHVTEVTHACSGAEFKEVACLASYVRRACCGAQAWNYEAPQQAAHTGCQPVGAACCCGAVFKNPHAKKKFARWARRRCRHRRQPLTPALTSTEEAATGRERSSTRDPRSKLGERAGESARQERPTIEKERTEGSSTSYVRAACCGAQASWNYEAPQQAAHTDRSGNSSGNCHFPPFPLLHADGELKNP